MPIYRFVERQQYESDYTRDFRDVKDAFTELAKYQLYDVLHNEIKEDHYDIEVLEDKGYEWWEDDDRYKAIKDEIFAKYNEQIAREDAEKKAKDVANELKAREDRKKLYETLKEEFESGSKV